MLNYNFRNACSPIIEQIINFHDWVIISVLSISLMTLRAIVIIIKMKVSNRSILDSQGLERVWTLVPAVILTVIGLPSLRLLYLADEGEAPTMTIKTVGHQWYWQYDYPLHPSFDSYMVRGAYRLLDVDNRLQTPIGHAIQILVTAADVLHSWTLPSIGIKADAVPGRVNKLSTLRKQAGVFYGQCREICGSNHRFMPIVIECYEFN